MTLHEQLIAHEGLRLTVYRDSLGIETIGVGRNLRDKGLTEEEALYLLDHDLDECVADLQTFPWFPQLDGIRQRVLIDMRFNLGPSRFRQFRQTLALVAQGDYVSAADQMLKSQWAKQVKGRAIRLAQMMRTGADL